MSTKKENHAAAAVGSGDYAAQCSKETFTQTECSVIAELFDDPVKRLTFEFLMKYAKANPEDREKYPQLKGVYGSFDQYIKSTDRGAQKSDMQSKAESSIVDAWNQTTANPQNFFNPNNNDWITKSQTQFATWLKTQNRIPDQKSLQKFYCTFYVNHPGRTIPPPAQAGKAKPAREALDRAAQAAADGNATANPLEAKQAQDAVYAGSGTDSFRNLLVCPKEYNVKASEDYRPGAGATPTVPNPNDGSLKGVTPPEKTSSKNLYRNAFAAGVGAVVGAIFAAVALPGAMMAPAAIIGAVALMGIIYFMNNPPGASPPDDKKK